MDKTLLTQILHNEIPITRHIGIQVKQITENSINLFAPLDNNTNHKSTAFGGSLYSVCVLTGWSLLFVQLEKLGEHGHIVIQESEIQYLLPVTTDFIAQCNIDDDAAFVRATKLYQRKGKARFELHTSIFQNHALAVAFKGKYVIHR